MKYLIQNRIDNALRHQKTLVPDLKGQWIICRNDPNNFYDPDGEFGICKLIVVVAIIVNDMIEPTTVATSGTEKEAEEYQQNYDHNGILNWAGEENTVYDTYSFAMDPGVGTALAFIPLAGGAFRKIPSGATRKALNADISAAKVFPGSLKRQFPSEHLDKSLNEIKSELRTAKGSVKKSLQAAKKILENIDQLMEKKK